MVCGLSTRCVASHVLPLPPCVPLLRYHGHRPTVLPITPAPGTWRRLRTKTAWPPQRSLLAPVQLGGDTPTDQQRQVYLVTLPFPRQQRAGLSGPRMIVPIACRALCVACHRCAPQSVLRTGSHASNYHCYYIRDSSTAQLLILVLMML